MSNELIISANAPEINIALLENKQLIEFSKETTNTRFAVGDIYLAKVKKVVSGLNAVFVDLGYEKDAFLHYHDLGPQFSSLNKLLNVIVTGKQNFSFEKFGRIPDIDKNGNIADVITAGQEILVQVAKEPISTKGPRLSSEISIAGRNIVLLPFFDKVTVSQKIKSNDEKIRLRKIVQSIKPDNYGVIVRTVAVGKKVSELESELKELVAKWEKTLVRIKKYKTATPKLVLSEIDRVNAMIRDILNPSFTNIIIDNLELYEDIKEFITIIAPEKEKIVKHYSSGPPLFEQYGVEKQVRALFGKNVAVKNGAYLIIEHTEALHVIDVNSGNRTKSDKDQESNAFDVNAVAAVEIARQLRLRDMGGIIVVDFIDMRDPENKAKLYEVMKEAMAGDRAKHNILPLSKFGLMQITRQRVRPEQSLKINETCPSCQGTGEISPSINLVDKIEDDVKHISRVLKKRYVRIKLHPYMAGYLTKGIVPLALRWSLKYGIFVRVESRSSYNYLEYKFALRDRKKITL